MFPVKTFSILVILLISITFTNLCFGANNVTVFIYHRFGESNLPTTNVSVAAFTQQMEYLHTHQYNVIPLADLIAKVKQGIPIPAKTVVLTIDDAYQSVYENGWPVLHKYGFPFTLFVYTKGVDDAYGGYMTWTQLRELQDAGVDIQDHGYGHHRLGWRPEGLTIPDYKVWLREDISKSRAIMTREMGERPRFFALPYGVYNNLVLDELRNQGYESVLTQAPGAVGAATDLFAVPRQPILGNEWSTLEHFITSLDLMDLPLTDYQPGPTLRNDPFIKTIQATLTYPDQYIDGTFGIWLSGLGWHQADLKDDILSVELHKKLIRPTTQVVVSGRHRESGRLATRTWQIIHPEGEKGGSDGPQVPE